MEFKENRYDGEQQVVAALAAKQKYTEDVSGEAFRKKVEARLFTAAVDALVGGGAARGDQSHVAVAPGRRARPAQGGVAYTRTPGGRTGATSTRVRSRSRRPPCAFRSSRATTRRGW